MSTTLRVLRASVVGILFMAAGAARAKDEEPPPSLEEAIRALRRQQTQLQEILGQDSQKTGGSLLVPSDEGAGKQLDAAAALAGRKQWDEAARFYQEALDRSRRALVQAESRELRVLGDVVAATILAGPKELLEAYRQRAEPLARALFREGVSRRDLARVLEVLERYGATAAGRDAARLLMEDEIGREHPLAAWTFFERLRLHGVPDTDPELQKSAAQLAALARRQGLPLIAEALPVPAAPPERDAPAAEKPARAPRLEPAWEAYFPKNNAAYRGPLEDPFRWERRMPLRQRPSLPLTPAHGGGLLFLADDDRMLAYKTGGGKRAMDARPPRGASYNAPYGLQEIWRAVPDGDQVYGIVPDAEGRVDQRIVALVSLPTRDLLAFSTLKPGEILWSAKQAAQARKTEWPGSLSFPAPPAADGKRLFAGATSFQGLFTSYLVRLDPRDGAARWTTFLCSGQQEMNYFGRPVRESVPGTPVPMEETVFQCTNLGAVASVDAGSGRIVWMHLYDQVALANQGTQMTHLTPRLSGWKNLPPVCYGSVLVAAPTDSPHLLGLDARTGRMLWKREREGMLYGLGDPSIPVYCAYSEGRAVGVHPKTGKLLWEKRLVGPESFPGVLAKGVLYIPLVDTVEAIDIRTGRTLYSLPCGAKAGPLWTDGETLFCIRPDGEGGTAWKITWPPAEPN